ncbi:MAG TPA: sigma 54-interacting transcriptional regulator [Polyangiaceae bacterium]|nr:sigma 54-interacting transcriptional regulator [Polyangiaceae bacterium]
MDDTPKVTSGGDGSNETLELDRAPPRAIWLLELAEPDAARRIALGPGKALTIGSGASASVRVADRTVSAAHCRITAERHGLVIRDLGSKNGLFVGGARVTEAVLARTGCGFMIGRTSVVVGSEPARSKAAAPAVPGLVGDSRAIRRVAEEVVEAARCRATVLIQGESGTGKDVVARALHQLSGRRGAYVPINAAAFPDALADSELFGHRRGAFTGAVDNRTGAFEQADRGTLFLDEVVELSPAVQVRLLRVVEDGQIRPLGGTTPRQVDVRLISASWADLGERVQLGRFRADLYHRLSTLVITLPALRERKDDIPALSAALLQRLQGDLGPKVVSAAALDRLLEYSWPGNVRELGGVLYRAGLRAPSECIEPEHLVLGSTKRRRPELAVLTPAEARELYELHGRNKSAAARAAAVPRSTFRGWLDRGSLEQDAGVHPRVRSCPGALAPDAPVPRSGSGEP